MARPVPPAADLRHFVSVRDLGRARIERLLESAARYEAGIAAGTTWTSAQGRVLVSAFFEPSTRTRLSFETAIARLGGAAVGFGSPEGTSVAKGETLADTVRVLSGFGDVVALRHPRDGAARLAARFSRVPLVNAGDGALEHPTQALVDLFTLKKACGRLDDLSVALAGDLRHARTVRSLALALAGFGATLVQATAPELALPQALVDDVAAAGGTVVGPMAPEEAVPKVDALYVTRVQAERFPSAEAAARAPRPRIDRKLLSAARPGLAVLHPLPRLSELPAEVDALPSARYFDQARAGVPVRMAVLAHVLGLED